MKHVIPGLIIFVIGLSTVWGQPARIQEESRLLKTYPFGDPDPVPIFASNPKIYPYYKYEAYEHEAVTQAWKVIKMENDYIEVYVLPEVGGKVWGAIDKSSGQEFIYRNEVMKFRNISMRGPWTSGGIEFNFGIIGHHPSTATPVDYIMEEHPDGSVSCTVGNIDLTSRTHWRVTISLKPDEAFFRTKAVWYNPTEVPQSYYNWMTAAAFAQEDLVFYTPGDQYLKHSGEAVDWPRDLRSRNLSIYAENNFGPSKSYHVVGEYNNFFGGYFEKEGYGFGHVSDYEEMPGQKLWLWALSRSGGIWEDLLTDTDGQYIEFQAGRLFVQYAPGAHQNPVTNVAFEPLTTDVWEEVWFPVNEIGGISDASEKGVMHVHWKDDKAQLKIMGLKRSHAKISVTQKENLVFSDAIELNPLQVWSKPIALDPGEDYEIHLSGMDLFYASNPDRFKLKRPFASPNDLDPNAQDFMLRSAREDVAFREYDQARQKLMTILDRDPYHLEALVQMGMLLYRSGQYPEALRRASAALSLDTYHPGANFLAGNLYWALDDPINALDSYGWAARSMSYRSAAYAKMAQIHAYRQAWEQARDYAMKALNYNAQNIPALQSLLLSCELLDDHQGYQEAYRHILALDPLNHLARLEGDEVGQSIRLDEVGADHRSELAYQTILELALIYHNHGLTERAYTIVSQAPSNWLVELWKDYLDNGSFDRLSEISRLPTQMVFPFRRESLHLLTMAEKSNDHWKFKYWKGLVMKGLRRHDEASKLFIECDQDPDDPSFYITRAKILPDQAEADLLKAYQLAPTDWRAAHNLISHYHQKHTFKKALEIGASSLSHHAGNYVLEMDHIKTLYALGRLTEADAMLGKVKVLPFEGASEGRTIYAAVKRKLALNSFIQNNYNQALEHIAQARSWPEHLGVGKPYEPDERIEDYLTGMIHAAQGEDKAADQYFNKVIEYTKNHLGRASRNSFLGILKLIQRGQEEEAFSLLEHSMRMHGNDSSYSTSLKNWIKTPITKEVELLQQLMD